MESGSISVDGEAQLCGTTKTKHGGWITFPFIIGFSLHFHSVFAASKRNALVVSFEVNECVYDRKYMYTIKISSDKLLLSVSFVKAATLAGLTLAGGGWLSNLIVYLIDQFHINSIDAAQINNVVSGCTSLFPIVGAIVADSFLGSFAVIWISSIISLLVIKQNLTITRISSTLWSFLIFSF